MFTNKLFINVLAITSLLGGVRLGYLKLAQVLRGSRKCWHLGVHGRQRVQPEEAVPLINPALGFKTQLDFTAAH